MRAAVFAHLIVALGVIVVYCDGHGENVGAWSTERHSGNEVNVDATSSRIGGEDAMAISWRTTNAGRRRKRVWCKCIRKMVWNWKHCVCRRRQFTRKRRRVWCKCQKRMVWHRKYCKCPSSILKPISIPSESPGVEPEASDVEAFVSSTPEAAAETGFWCKCLQRNVLQRSRCCGCQKRKCKCWNPWWKKWKYRYHYCRRRCSRKC